MTDGPTAGELAGRTHSWREYEPQEFIQAAENSGKRDARSALKTVEDRRFYDFLKDGHWFFQPLDPDERQDWADANPDMMEWIGVYGYLEDLTTFPEYTGIGQSL